MIDLDELRTAASDSLAWLDDDQGNDDPLLRLIPGDGNEPAGPVLCGVVSVATASPVWHPPFTLYGAIRTGAVRSHLRRWAAAQ